MVLENRMDSACLVAINRIECVETSVMPSRQTLARSHPNAPLPVGIERKNLIRGKTLPGRKRGQRAVPNPAHSVLFRAGPDASIGAATNGSQVDIGHPILLSNDLPPKSLCRQLYKANAADRAPNIPAPIL